MNGRRALSALTLTVASVAAVLLVGALPAEAHPLGNATVNHYNGLTVSTERVVDQAVEDVAEIPTLQRKPRIDTDHDGTVSTAEASSYARLQCAAMASDTAVTVNGTRSNFAVSSASYAERPGAIQLMSGRLECRLSAPVRLTTAATLGFDSRWDSAGVGWHEITAVGDGVTLRNSPFPATSISNALRAYPNNLLSAPLDVSGGQVATAPGAGASTYAAVAALPGAGWAVRALDHITKVFDAQVGAKHLGLGAITLAVLLAVVLGAGHACLPGHGKTIMAAYLVGRRGRTRDVVAVGVTVTVTHTASVLVLGLVISLSSAFAPTQAEQALALISGGIVVAVGVGLFVAAVRRQRRSTVAVAEHVHTHAPALAVVGAGAIVADGHDHPHDHGHDHPHHDDAVPHSHGFGSHAHEPASFGRGGLIGLGIAGGLVPSPSALLVLLAAIALGRGAFGVVLVIAYGLGMAGTLSAAGLLLVRFRDRLARTAITGRFARASRFVGVLPFVTAGLVVFVGLVLTMRAGSGRL